MAEEESVEKINIHQICLKSQKGDKIISIHEFLSIPAMDRTELILGKCIEFRDANGKILPTLAAVQSLISKSPSWEPPH